MAAVTALAAAFLASAPLTPPKASAEIQTVSATQAVNMAAPLPKQAPGRIDKGKIWLAFAGGAFALFGATYALTEANSAFFPAIARANEAMAASRVQEEREAEREAAERKAEEEEWRRQQRMEQEARRRRLEAAQTQAEASPAPQQPLADLSTEAVEAGLREARARAAAAAAAAAANGQGSLAEGKEALAALKASQQEQRSSS